MNRSMTLSQLPPMAEGGRQIVPQPITTQYSFTPHNMPKVQCHYHSDQTIIYFCKETLMPLCSECAREHHNESVQKGRRTNIIPLEAGLTEVYSQLSHDANELAKQFDKLVNGQDDQAYIAIGDRTSLLTNPIKLIESAREQVHSIVDNYFNTLVTFIKGRVPEARRRPDVSNVASEVKQRWDEVIKDLELLNSNNCLRQMIHFFQGDTSTETQRVFNLSKQALKELETSINYLPNGLEIPQLHVDPLYLQKFLHALERYAYFFEPPFEEMYPSPKMNYGPPPPPQYYDPYFNTLPPTFIPPPVPPMQYPPYFIEEQRPMYNPPPVYNDPIQSKYYVLDDKDTISQKEYRKEKSKKKKKPQVFVHRLENTQDQQVVEVSRTQMPQTQNAIIQQVPYSRPSQIQVQPNRQY